MNGEMNGEMYGEMNRGVELLVRDLSKKFGFNVEEGLRHVGLGGGVKKKRVGGGGGGGGGGGRGGGRCQRVPLPWLGEKEGKCRALVYNQGLFTQCDVDAEEYCVSCVEKKESNNGCFPCGTVEDRKKSDFTGLKGRALVPYGNLLKKKEISREKAEAFAKEMGVTIPEEAFAVVERKRGRPKKVSTEVKDTPEKKRRGRPKKVEVVSDNPVDLIQTLVDQAENGGKPAEEKSAEAAKKVEEVKEEEEEEEEEVTVSRFTHNGVTYLRTDENVLYDETTQDPVGKWDPETQTVKEIEEESEEEEEE